MKYKRIACILTLATLFTGFVSVPEAEARRSYSVRSKRVKKAMAPVKRATGLRATGFFGPETDRSVRIFQMRAALPVDGIVGVATQRALGLQPGPVLRRGHRGPRVRALQIALLRALGAHSAPAPVRASRVLQTWMPERPVPPVLTHTAELPPRPVAGRRPPLLPPDPPAPPAWALPEPPVVPAPAAPRNLDFDAFPMPARPKDVSPLPEPPPSALPVSPLPQETVRPGASFDLRAGNWLVATPQGATTFDLARPGWNGSFTYWRGPWGVGGGYVMLPDGLQIIDAAVRWREDSERLNLGVGWRGMTQQLWGASLITADARSRLPLYADGPAAELSAHWGLGIPGGLFVDGYAGLQGQMGVVQLRGGYRALLTTGVTTPGMTTWQGPYLGVGVPL